MPDISRIWARSALISAGLQPQQENWNPGDWSAQLAYSSRSAARDGRPKTPRLQGNLSRRSRSYGHSMGVNTPARKSALSLDATVVLLTPVVMDAAAQVPLQAWSFWSSVPGGAAG